VASGSRVASTVVGIDVGGARKGFHAVALCEGTVVERLATTDEVALAAWCREVGAELVAVDAPCSWRSGAEARAAERELMGDGISCFVSPTREQALASSSGFYGWMLCGEALYRELARHGYALAEAADELRSQRRCFETFPHAITVQLHRALGLEPAVASRKRPERRALRSGGSAAAVGSRVPGVWRGGFGVAAGADRSIGRPRVIVAPSMTSA